MKKDIDTSNLKKEVIGLQMGNETLKQLTEKVERYLPKNNLSIIRLKETKGENLEVCITGFFNKFLNPESRFGTKTFERVHQLGNYKKDSDKTLIIRFARFKDNIAALQTRDVLSSD